MVSKWTHWLLKEGNNQKKQACIVLLSTNIRGREPVDKKMMMMERLPWRMSTIEH